MFNKNSMMKILAETGRNEALRYKCAVCCGIIANLPATLQYDWMFKVADGNFNGISVHTNIGNLYVDFHVMSDELVIFIYNWDKVRTLKNSRLFIPNTVLDNGLIAYINDEFASDVAREIMRIVGGK